MVLLFKEYLNMKDGSILLIFETKLLTSKLIDIRNIISEEDVVSCRIPLEVINGKDFQITREAKETVTNSSTA